MDRYKRTFWFWAIVLVAVMLPVSGETRTKRLYKANIMDEGFGRGSAVVGEAPSGFDFIARSQNLPNGVVTKASLTNGTWHVVLCENGGLAGDCTYDATGNLDISGAINGPMLGLAGITGGMFATTLRGGNLWIYLNDGVDGTGNFVRII
jgi:hypothetical protein